MADSHGQPNTILAALIQLKRLNCRTIFHLGDVCDSTRPETVEACLRPLREHGVITVKGNNDHAIVANQLGLNDAKPGPAGLKYIRDLPLAISYHNAVLTHSLPFVDRLGLACMIGTMSEKEARDCFIEFPRHVIFRGHSHRPEILFARGARIVSRTPAVGVKIHLSEKLPCVITCGALTRGWYMIWDAEKNYIVSLAFDG